MVSLRVDAFVMLSASCPWPENASIPGVLAVFVLICHYSYMRTRLLLLPLLATAGLTGCTSPASGPGGLTGSAPPRSTPWLVSGEPRPSLPLTGSGSARPGAPLIEGTSSGVFQPYPQGTRAVTYDPKVVPPGSTASVIISRTASGITVRLAVTGMVPGRAYGAHLHTKPCTAVPAEAGPHYQHSPDPRAAASPPSVDPSYANPRNEVWLDFTAGARGAATAAATQNWTFDEVEPPRSLIVHEQPTSTAAGTAGTAGARVACLTLAPR
jgi:Cu-Zn family superoxide dismutase